MTPREEKKESVLIDWFLCWRRKRAVGKKEGAFSFKLLTVFFLKFRFFFFSFFSLWLDSFLFSFLIVSVKSFFYFLQ